MSKIKLLVDRLWSACKDKPDFGGDLWARGLEVIQRKYEVLIYLSKFEPLDMTYGEVVSAWVTVDND